MRTRDGTHTRAGPGRRLSSRCRGCHCTRCGSRTGGACCSSVVVARPAERSRVIPFPALIAHPASMVGFNVSPSVTATVLSPRLRHGSRKTTATGLPRSSLHGTAFWSSPAWAEVAARSDARATRKDFAYGARGYGIGLIVRLNNAWLSVWGGERAPTEWPFPDG